MGGSSEALHEDPEKLKPETIERHRAIVSLREELEAIDWYDQRVDATDDEDLRAVLAHNRDEEKEHACMTLEWLRRNSATWDEELRTYLFTEGAITKIEKKATGNGKDQNESGSANSDESLGIGSLKGGSSDE